MERHGWRLLSYTEFSRQRSKLKDAAERVIVYAWVNDERTLRSAGSKTDPYTVFARMLAQGDPPNDWASLIAGSAQNP